MIGKIALKRAIKQTANLAVTLASPIVTRHGHAGACIFVYHRVAPVGFVDPHVDDWNVPPHVFERQIAALAEVGEFVLLTELLDRLACASPPKRPLICLTFDDGYANFYTEALPILKRYNAPAALFVVTSLIGQAGPLPFDRWSRDHQSHVAPEGWRSLNWAELEGCLASGLVTLGAHSHRHLKGRECTPAQMDEEAGESRAILLRHCGEAHARAYAYPYGSRRLGYVPSEYVNAVRRAGFRCALTTELGRVSAGWDPYLLPRIEAHALDTPHVVRAKVTGTLAPYSLIERLRQSRRMA